MKKTIKFKGKVRGFTCGVMDLLHAGHVMMLKEARDHCDYLIVGLQTDPTIDRKDKNMPVQSVEERKIQLEGCRYVDEVVVYETETDLVELLKEIKPDVRILGEDWKDKDYTGRELDIKTVFNSRDHAYSSTELRERINDAVDMTKMPRVKVIEPNIVAMDGRYGDKHEVTHVVLQFERDITIFFDRSQTGEHVAILPVKITYRRKLI